MPSQSDPAQPDAVDTPMLADELMTITWALARQLRLAGNQESELSLTQWAVLSHLERQPAMTSAELARAELVTPQSMNTAVHQLRELALVQTQPVQGDGRRIALTLTEAGAKALADLRERRAAWLVRFLDAELSETERADLYSALQTLRRAGQTARVRAHGQMG